MNRSSGERDETPSRPLTFRAAESLGAFELAQLWADRTAWPIDERTQYDELSELAVMSALGAWLRRWQPIAIHSAMLAGARPEAIEGASRCPSPDGTRWSKGPPSRVGRPPVQRRPAVRLPDPRPWRAYASRVALPLQGSWVMPRFIHARESRRLANSDKT
jgi:hypothetical protein